MTNSHQSSNFSKKLISWKNYYQNPKHCKFCNTVLDWFKRYNQFCTSSCSAKANNLGRTHSDTTKLKIAQTNTGKKRPNSKPPLKACFTSVKLSECPQCKKFSYKRVTSNYCSKECAVTKRIKNGIKSIQYEYKGIFLDSSWELKLAQFLDANSIDWERPKGVKYGTKTYFPDFYLPKYDLYLDPKNPYLISISQDKMNQIEQLINIWYGDVNEIMARLRGFEPPCSPVTFQLVRSEQGYKRI